MSFDIERFRQTYFEESLEGIDIMESGLLELDVGDADGEVINTIFRAAHSIKGGSTTFGTAEIGSFTHVMETLLDLMREGEMSVEKDLVDLLLDSVDCLKDMLVNTQAGEESDKARIAVVQQQLEKVLDKRGPESESESESSTEEATTEATPKAQGWQISFRPHQEMLTTGNDPVRMMSELEDLGSITVKANTDSLPTLQDLNPLDSFLHWEIELQGDATEDEVNEVFEWVIDECDLTIKPLAAAENDSSSQDTPSAPNSDNPNSDSPNSDNSAPAEAEKETSEPKKSQAATPPAAKPAKKETSSTASSIRVSIDKIDTLVNMVGELVITQSMLGELGENFEMSRMERLNDGLTELERNTRELQEAVMRIRMLPISFVFNRIPRLVRDLSTSLNKKVVLKTLGEQTELDKTVLEKIGDPLVHLVRNSADHGIEMPEEREAAGKPATGTVELNAFHQGGHIVIEVKDDGAGLNRDRILKKAKEKGLVSDEEELSTERIDDLIFHPGFSTAEVVSSVSGRGVGMDVVRRNIKSLGGVIRVDSEPGVGTAFSIRLPLTLAILDGQLVRVGDTTYVIPLVSIVESLQIKQDKINPVARSGDVYTLRDDYIPIIRLHEAFGMIPDSSELAGGLMVVVEGEGQPIGLVVDDLLSQQQVVIKSLEANYSKVEGLSGATILGDGTVALILDIGGLVRLSKGVAPLVESF